MTNENKERLSTVHYALCGVLLLILPIEGSTALRNTLLFLVLVLAGVRYLAAGRDHRPALSFPLLKSWLSYALIAGLGLLWAVDFSYSLKEFEHEILIAAIFFWLGVNLYRDAKAWKWLAASIVVGNVLLVGYCLVVWVWGGTTKGPWVATYNSGPGNFSTYLVTVLPCLVLLLAQAIRGLQQRKAIGLGLLVLANFAAMYVTQNRQVYVAVVLQLVVASAFFASRLRQPRYLMLVLAIVACLATLFHLQSGKRIGTSSLAETANIEMALQGDGRLPVWQFAIEQALQHPLHGAGIGRNAFSRLYPDHPLSQPPFDHTHNMLINRLVQLGFPGLLVFVLLLGGVAWTLLSLGRRSGEGRWLAAAGLAVCAGVLAKNMTDDFFVRELGYLFWLLCGALIGTQSGQAKVLGPVRKIIVIRRDNIGDLICTTPLFSALRSRFPEARIDALVNSYNRLVLERNPDIDHVFAYTKAKHREAGESVPGIYLRRIKLMLGLRAQAYDYVVLANDGDTKRTLKLARWIAPRQVIGYGSPGEAVDRRLDIPLSLDPEPRHAVEIAFALLAPLGISGPAPALKLVPDSAQRESIRRQLESRFGQLGGPTIAIHVSARKPSQRWPAERFVALMQELHGRFAARFVLLWAPGSSDNPMHPGDDEKAAAIAAAVATLPVLACPTEHLDDLISAIAACDSMICADGGAMHVGAALAKPLVCFFGDSDAVRWRPWGVPYQLLQPGSLDVADISVAEAVSAYVSLGLHNGPDSGRPG